MIKGVKRLWTSKFISNIRILITGSALAQVVVLIISPLLTRLYSVEAIGVYTYFLSIAHMFMAVVCLRYDISIVNEENQRKVLALVKISFFVSLISSFFISIGFYIHRSGQPSPQINVILFTVLMFMVLVSYGIINVLSAYNNRLEEYKLLTKVYLLRTIAQNLGALLLGVLWPSPISLMVPYLLGQFVGVRKQWSKLACKYDEIKDVTTREMCVTAIAHVRQPLFSSPALFANSFAYSSLAVFIEILFGFRYVGFYSMSVRALGVPIALISGNVSKVFFREASVEYQEHGTYWRAYKKTLVVLCFIALPMSVVIALIAPKLSSLVLGKEWIVAGEYMRALAPMYGARFITTALSPGLQVSGKQAVELVLQLLLLAVSVSAFLYAKANGTSIEAFLVIVNWLSFLVFVVYAVVVGWYGYRQRER